MITMACDFGGRRIKLGIVRDSAMLAYAVLPSHAETPLIERLPDVTRTLRELCTSHDVDLSAISGMGVSYPSVIDPQDGCVLDHFGKFGDVRSLDLRAWARTEFGVPLAIENDARMALIGEWQYGAGRGHNNIVIMTLGTGIGTAALIEGRPLVGLHGQAGILGGHLTVTQHGRPCVCGNRGCAEAEASTSVLPDIARQIAKFDESPLARLPTLSYEDVFRGQRGGDSTSERLADASLQIWSALAVNLIHAYDPELLILGGGVMGSRAIILPAITAYVDAHAHTPWGKVSIVPSELGDSAALLAAEWLIAQRFQQGVRD